MKQFAQDYPHIYVDEGFIWAIGTIKEEEGIKLALTFSDFMGLHICCLSQIPRQFGRCACFLVYKQETNLTSSRM
jgi:hypothetical protein